QRLQAAIARGAARHTEQPARRTVRVPLDPLEDDVPSAFRFDRLGQLLPIARRYARVELRHAADRDRIGALPIRLGRARRDFEAALRIAPRDLRQRVAPGFAVTLVVLDGPLHGALGIGARVLVA